MTINEEMMIKELRELEKKKEDEEQYYRGRIDEVVHLLNMIQKEKNNSKKCTESVPKKLYFL